MADFELTVHSDSDFQVVDILLLDGGLIVPDSLRTKTLPAVDPQQGVILSGRAPLWLYAHLVCAYASAPWTAIFNPRLGAVVVASRVPGRRPGEVIPLEKVLPVLPRHESARKQGRPTPASAFAVALVGPPHSGKSVLLNALWQRLQMARAPSCVQREMFVLRACPDGEGMWAGETKHLTELRYKSRWDEEFVQRVCDHIKALRRSKSLLLVDCGGIIDRRNASIWNQCTHALIVSSDAAVIPAWRGAVQASDLVVLAEVVTSLSSVSEIVESSPLRVKLGPTERGKAAPVVPDELIQALDGLM